jgi:D-beta-D-heptose 7-phosphate kinase/D-beta-D-heptose 1-phosphate adenosyltransferase
MMAGDTYRDLIKKFSSLRVLAIGDIYLDENIFGVVHEVSLEAPIPVFEVHERRYNPGAAGNAACNAAALGAHVRMIGVVGEDMNAEILRREFAARGVNTDYLVPTASQPTNTYGKWRAGGETYPYQEVLRTDTPRPKPITGEVEKRVIENVQAVLPNVDAVLLGDQVGSVLTRAVWETIRREAHARNLVTLVDSRSRAAFFEGVFVAKPNEKEVGVAVGMEVHDEASLNSAAQALLRHAQNVLVTRGSKGIRVFTADGNVEDVPTRQVRAVDVTGAGDTVAAAALLTLAAGGTLRDAAFLGNMAASLAVEQEGVVTISHQQLEALLFGRHGPAKVKTLEELVPIVTRLKQEGKRIVWTNGCFDILHAGHITYLLRARAAGDVLVVGLNSDRSVQAIKGPSRPIIPEADRALVLSALAPVDYIVIFDTASPLPLIQVLQPDVYAKGGDYTLDTINQEERRAVEAYGGEIVLLPGVEGKGTTQIIERIRSEFGMSAE